MFNLKTAGIYQAVKWGRWFKWAKSLNKVFLIVFVLVFLVFLYGFLAEALNKPTLSLLLGLSIIFLTFTVALWIKLLFFDSKLSKPKLKTELKTAISNPEGFNLAEFLSFEVAKAVWKAKNNSTHLFYHLLKDNPELNFVFNRSLLSVKDIKKILKQFLEKIPNQAAKTEPSIEFQALILDSLKIAEKKEHQRVEIGDMLTAVSKHDLIFRKILIDANLRVHDVENLTWWLESLKKRVEENKKFWEWKNLIKRGSLAKQWTAGFTPTLDKLSIDLSETVKKQGFPEIIGHKEAIKAMERILARKESNNDVLIVGEPGSGRKSMIQALAKKSVLGESLPEVNYKRIVQLDLTSLLAQVESFEDVGRILDAIFREMMAAGNIILVIDEFHNFVGEKTLKPGMIDISGVLVPFLSLPQFQVVAITTYEGLHKNIEQNPSLLALFGKVEVDEISERETLMLLEDLSLLLEYKYKIFVSYQAIRDIINYCSKYLPATPFPEKAMELLDDIAVYVSQGKERVVLPKHVARIISEKVEIPIGEIEIKEREILLNLENLIHQRIINQEEAVDEISAALRRARAEVTTRKGPMGCFLFLGPTGVGKTETSKALTEIYFGSESKMIRLDMSEFQSVSDIPRLIGSPGEEGLLTTKARENPFSSILLDEIEKAHPNVLNLFLQVLDEGHLTDGLGRKVNFKNSIIVATSNAGYRIILKAIREKVEWSGVKEKLLDYLFEEGIFRPEFINRFDAVIVFKPLTKENLLDIAALLLKSLKKNLEQKDIEFIITESLKEKMVELGYDPTFGARQMKRVIQDKIENVLASGLLSGKIKRGDRVEVDPEEFKLKVNS